MKNRSKALLIANILSTAYVIYLFCYFVGGTASSNAGEALGFAIASTLVAPHAILFLIGAVFGWLGLLLRKGWGALVGAILYSVGTLFFLAYFMFGVPIIVLGFIGFANQRRINLTAQNA